MMNEMAPTVRFSNSARQIGRAARDAGLDVPTFRSPPRQPGMVRTIRRSENGVTISIAIRDRPWSHVLADLIDGVVAANGLAPPEAIRVRTMLWAALETEGADAA